MIYIDPPYNTGNNLLYLNDFSSPFDEYRKNSNQYDEFGNRLVLNLDSNGRFHTDWLNMIYPTLKIAKDFLRKDGYIVIAIDDNELCNLRKILDEIFGELNFVGTIVSRCNPQGRNKNNIDPVHEYHLVYAKNIFSLPLLKIKKNNYEKSFGYLIRGGSNSRKNERPYRFFPMLIKDNKISTIENYEYEKIYDVNNGFNEEYLRILKDKYESQGYKYLLPISKNGEEKVWQRSYERVKTECEHYIYENGSIKIPSDENRTPISLWTEEKYSNVAYGSIQLKSLFETDFIPFDFPKSVYTVKDLISLNTSNDDIILDFFSGSATTAHAVLQLNFEDGGKRKFIMVQLNEKCNENSEAYKHGYKNICEIGKNRIKLIGNKIKSELENTIFANEINSIDVGFRVFKLDSSNMKDVYYKPSVYTQQSIEYLWNNIKEDRTPLDLLFQVMLELSKPLSSKIEEITVINHKILKVDNNDLVCCFEENITDEVVTMIAKLHPSYVVFRDSSIMSDSFNINFNQIFSSLSPNTKIRIL